jgi:branched-chain amino acid transport system ATP-binding protein
MSKILQVNDLQYYYDDTYVIKKVSLFLEAGELITLIGSNGAGKTTILKCISGLLGTIKYGSIIFFGKRINDIPYHKIVSMGLCQVLEGRQIFSHLTVKENLILGAYQSKYTNEIINDNLNKIYYYFPILKERQNQLGGTLSGGEQQMLAISRALMGNPKVLLLDEPSLGLAPLIVKEIYEIIKKIREEGISILLVEQNAKIALDVADRGYVLETGNIVLNDKAEKLLNNKNVQKSYLGF